MAALLFISLQATAQGKFFTKTGRIKFDATAPKSPESIVGVNNAVICVLDTKTGNIQFSAVMKSFEFQAALMEEHFNENYVESNKFPKSEFKGLVTNNNSVNYAKDGTYRVRLHRQERSGQTGQQGQAERQQQGAQDAVHADGRGRLAARPPGRAGAGPGSATAPHWHRPGLARRRFPGGRHTRCRCRDPA